MTITKQQLDNWRAEVDFFRKALAAEKADNAALRAALAERDAQLADARRERDEAAQKLSMSALMVAVEQKNKAAAGLDALALELVDAHAQLREADAVIEMMDELARDDDFLLAKRASKALTAWREKTANAAWRVK